MKEYQNDYEYIEPLCDETYDQYINRILKTRDNIRLIQYYQERHHIKPKCLGGNNNKQNLIWLFAEEHYYAHKMLAKENPHEKKLVYPWWKMSTDGIRKITAQDYKEAKESFIKVVKGIPLTEEQKAKLSQSFKEKYKKEKHPWIGRKHSEESKKKISENHADVNGQNNPNYGKQCSEETKKKIGKANKGKQPWLGKHHTEESKNKMSESKKGIKWSKERKQSFKPIVGEKNKHSKQIKCVETGIVYISVKEASKQTGFDKSSIAQCARGETKTCHNYHWEYINKEENK